MGIMVTFTGKAGSGKSTILTNTACLLARERQVTVACLSCDMRYPSLPFFFKGVDVPAHRSIGKLFADPTPATQLIEYPDCKGVFVTATAVTDSAMEYEPPGRETILAFFQRLNNAFDVLLVEAGEYQLNFFSALAVRQCDVLINVITQTIQSLAWEKANVKLLEELRDGQPIHILNADSDSYPSEDFKRAIGNMIVSLPYLDQLLTSTEQGEPFCLQSSFGRSGRRYYKGIERLADIILEGGEME